MKVAFFPGCMVDMFYPEVGMAAVRVLERLGFEVELPDEQICCGQMFINSGFGPDAIAMMKRTVDAYEGYEVIVSLTGSCAYAIKDEYPRYLADDPVYSKKLHDVGSRIFEFTEFLVDVLGIKDLGAKLEGKATYHMSCHLTRFLGVRQPPVELLKHVEGLEYVEMEAPDRCCGFGGTFSVKEPEISEQMVREKVKNALATGADYLIGADQACLMNMKGCLDRMRVEGETDSNMEVLHIAQVLDMVKEDAR